MNSSKASADHSQPGRPIPPRNSPPRSSSWLLTAPIRLFIWICLATIIFRCPSSPHMLDQHSPSICEPYLNLKGQVTPYIYPYYKHYAAPYVKAAQPYMDNFNTHIYHPAQTFVLSSYQTYGEPQVTQIQRISYDKWETVLKPQIDNGRLKALRLYRANLGPLMDPYILTTTEFLNSQYQAVYPYVLYTYESGSRLVTEVALPYGQWAGNVCLTVLQRQVWPQLRVLYGKNVQPQLSKIQERLASYREGKRIEAAAEAEDFSSIRSTTKLSSTRSTVAPNLERTTERSVSPEDTTTLSEKTPSRSSAASVKPSDDLKRWEAKFARAADKGADELRSRLSEITEKQIEQQVQGTGEALITKLETTVSKSLVRLKAQVQEIVSDAAADESIDVEGLDSSAAIETVNSYIRHAGQQIKEAAQELRSWRRSFNEETTDLVRSASQSTLEVVDNIRDLGLQEIGLRWASLDDKDVSYEDWSSYNALRKKFAEWRGKVHDVASEHHGLTKSREAAEDVEARGMKVTEDAAKELARLKEVAIWKVRANDASDDFSTRYMPPVMKNAEQKIMDGSNAVSEAIMGSSSQGAMDYASSKLSKKAEEVASDASSIASSIAGVPESSAASLKDSATSAASSSSSSVTSQISSKSKSVDSSMSSVASSASSKPSSKVRSAASDVSSSRSSALSTGSSLSDSAQSVVSSETSDFKSSASSLTDSAASIASSMASSATSVTDAAASVLSSLSSSLSSKTVRLSEELKSSASSISSSLSSLDPTDSRSSAFIAASSLSSRAQEQMSSATSEMSASAAAASRSASPLTTGSQTIVAGDPVKFSRADDDLVVEDTKSEHTTDIVKASAESASSKFLERVSEAGEDWPSVTEEASRAMSKGASAASLSSKRAESSLKNAKSAMQDAGSSASDEASHAVTRAKKRKESPPSGDWISAASETKKKMKSKKSEAKASGGA